ncbi:hypothetical protein JCM10212_006649 [Sporobolomyces blumeae]
MSPTSLYVRPSDACEPPVTPTRPTLELLPPPPPHPNPRKRAPPSPLDATFSCRRQHLFTLSTATNSLDLMSPSTPSAPLLPAAPIFMPMPATPTPSKLSSSPMRRSPGIRALSQFTFDAIANDRDSGSDDDENVWRPSPSSSARRHTPNSLGLFDFYRETHSPELSSPELPESPSTFSDGQLQEDDQWEDESDLSDGSTSPPAIIFARRISLDLATPSSNLSRSAPSITSLPLVSRDPLGSPVPSLSSSASTASSPSSRSSPCGSDSNVSLCSFTTQASTDGPCTPSPTTACLATFSSMAFFESPPRQDAHQLPLRQKSLPSFSKTSPLAQRRMESLTRRRLQKIQTGASATPASSPRSSFDSLDRSPLANNALGLFAETVHSLVTERARDSPNRASNLRVFSPSSPSINNPCSRRGKAPDTPSRVLRRIEDLNQQSLPDLPGLPADQSSFTDDGDSTIAQSPAPRPRTSPLASSTTRAGSPAPLEFGSPTPYTSTPAPSTAYQRSQSTIVPSATSTRYSENDLTATARQPFRNQVDSLRRSGRRTPTRVFYDETGSNDTVDAIARVQSMEEEDMVVLSGSGGEDSDREANAQRIADVSELPTAQLETQEMTEDQTDDQTTRDDGVELSQDDHPLDVLGGLESALPVPVRPISPRDGQVSPKEASASALSPLRERDVNSTVASPELGRNSSPRPSSHSMISHLSDQTPSRHVEKTPSTSLTPRNADPPQLDSPIQFRRYSPGLATPAANPNSDAARRANHLLTTLRSTAKPRFVRGTPHPLRSVRKAATPSALDDDQRSTSSFASDHSSNDLTTFHPKANTSLPSGGSADVGGAATGGTRFNGAKLNAYLHQLNTHLTEENQQLVKTLKKTTEDNERLQHTIREMSVAGGISVDVSRSKWRSRTNSADSEGEADGTNEGSRIEALGKELEGLVDGQRRIRGLQDQLDGRIGGKDAATRIQELEEELERTRRHVDERDDEVAQLREQVVSSKPSTSANDDTVHLASDLQQEIFDLKDALDAATSDRDAAQADLVKLQADFASAGQASEKDYASLQARVDELLEDLQEKDVEVEAVKQLLVEQETEFAEKMELLETELSKVMEEQERKIEAAREDLELRRKEDEATRKADREALDKVKAERDALERRLEKEGKALDDELAKQVASLKREVSERDEEIGRLRERIQAEGKTGQDVDDLRTRLREKEEEIQQLEGALDESANQLLQNEDDLAVLRSQLASEKQVNSSLSAQISQLSVVKAKSPLGNEAYNSNQDDVIASLEEELDAARQEIVDLQRKLNAEAEGDISLERRDNEIRNLETTKVNLEDRVKSLRQQVSMQYSPSKTPDKSWLLKPLPTVRTPKTPGQLLSNLSTWSPGSAANETISPLLAQIHELEQMVEHLQNQLSTANAQIDNKLDRLEAAGFDTIAIARKLSAAQLRIAELESQLDKLLGENGSIERVRARLAKVHCPDCSTAFDANKLVQLRVDGIGISFDGSSAQTSAVDTLRADLAAVSAKLAQLRTENSVLSEQASRTKELAADKATLLAQQEALSKDLSQSRSEITTLEADLRTERSRLRSLTDDLSAAGKAKSTLEARVASLEADLRKSSVNPASTAELDALRDALRAKEAEQRSLHDERGDILRGVASLQADMNRVRQEAISLGLDLASVRRERDEIAKRQEQEKGSQSVDSKTIEELRARHKQESKGLLVLVRQLKLRVNREILFRHQAGEQKEYLSTVVAQKQATIDSIMSQLNLPIPSQQVSRPTLRSAALAVCALARMRRLSQQWKEDSAPKKRLRDQAYPDVRGKPFAAA